MSSCLKKEIKEMVRVAVVGTAGRGDDLKRMTSDLYDRMVMEAGRILLDEWKLDPSKIILVSGGSSWSDHVAIDLFLHDKRFYDSKMHLYFPCPFDVGKSQYHMESNHFLDCGNRLNWLHNQFSKKRNSAKSSLAKSSLHDISEALQNAKCNSTVHKGFFYRNLEVGKCDYLLAFTWSQTDKPADGGTAHTWKNSNAKTKHHITLHSFLPPSSSSSSTPLNSISKFAKKRKIN
jgi:hypothetical protein